MRQQHTIGSITEGIIYRSESEIGDVEEFQRGLQKRYPAVRVERASFIKTKESTTAYIVTFNQQYILHSIYIPGER